MLLGSLLVVDAGPVGAAHKLAAPSNVRHVFPFRDLGGAAGRVTWDAVTGANRYTVQYRESPSGSTLQITTANTFTNIGSLTAGQAYLVQVRAEDSTSTHTQSDYSDWVTFNAWVHLNDPTNLAVSAGDEALSLSWTASTSSGVSGYDVHYTSAASSSVPNGAAASGSDASAAWVAVTRTGTTASQTISSLSNGTTYRVRVRTKSSTGRSGWVHGTGSPLAESVTLSGPTTVAEGQSAVVTITASTAISGTADVDDRAVQLLSALGSAESADVADQVGGVELFMAQGATEATFEFTTNQDVDQDDETFTVSISTAPTGFRVGSPSSVTVTIVDDDKPSVSLSASPNPVPEGNPVTITAQLSHPTVNALEIPVRLTAGTAESGDYGALSEITVAAGASSG
ncbi:MAG: fibronectin type III domain-containing protein, partial [Acidimicrobiaceae bacterium]|nr:fibronectin type III domain-containing protein [Acidimicrobiaceae bacterium]